MQVEGPPGERVDPGHRDQPGARPDRRRQLRARQQAGRPQRPDPDSPLPQPQPGEHRGRVVTLDDQHLVARLPGQPVRDQVQPVGGAVAEHDLVRRAADQARQQGPQPLGQLAEIVIADPVRGGLQPGRLAGRFHRRPGQRALVGGVEPGPAIEGAELRCRPQRGRFRRCHVLPASPGRCRANDEAGPGRQGQISRPGSAWSIDTSLAGGDGQSSPARDKAGLPAEAIPAGRLRPPCSWPPGRRLASRARGCPGPARDRSGPFRRRPGG
jgi:hypothetical protein